MKKIIESIIETLKHLFTVKVEQNIEAKNTTGTSVSQVANIFNFLIPSFILAAALIALASWGYREYQNSKYNLTPMNGNINVAVAQFSDLTNNQCNLSKDVGLLIANSFFSRLENDGLRDEFYQTTETTLQTRSPEELPKLQGNNESLITKSAEQLASTINAHIVVYGTVTCSELTKQAYFQVMFYIAPSNFSDAQEIVGGFSFSANALYGNINAGDDFEDRNTELQKKVKVISLLIKAIGSFVGENYPLTLQYLEQANNTDLWTIEDGQEVIYIIKGNAESKMAHSLNVDGKEDEAIATIEKAAISYKKANDITKADPQKGDYGRSYIGLVGVEDFYLTMKALKTNKLEDLDLAALGRMKDMLKKAESAAYSPPTADIPVKVAFYQAHISLLLYELNTKDAANLTDAETNYTFVVTAFEGTAQTAPNPRIRELAARSYAGLALIARLNKNPENAIHFYQLALDASHVPGLKVQYLLSLGNAYEKNGNLTNALEIYKEALTQRNALSQQMSKEEIAALEKKMEEIENSLPTPAP